MARGSTSVLWGIGLLAVGLIVGLLLVLTRGARAPSVPPAATSTASLADAAAPEDAIPGGEEEAEAAPEAAEIAPELIATADELQQAYESRKEELPADMAAPIDEDIGMIEGVVADLLVAIAAEPNDESLKRMLIATYRNEVKLLKKALHLTSDTSDEEPAPDE